tara:strand:- start:984 stop:2234 length:1251 start_codon:yes stop_codon:yes gene_type:complete
MEVDVKLLKWQKKVWNDKTRFKCVAAGRRTGKSRLAAYMLLVKALASKKGNIFYVAPTQGQARDIMWNLLLELGNNVIASSHVNNMQIKLANGATISLKGADRPDTMRGVQIAFLCIDEYAEQKPETWELVLRPALTDLKGHALFIGTPVGRNHFYDLYKFAKLGDDEDWTAFHFTSYDNDLLDKSEIDAAKKSMSSYAFRQEFMASFEARGSEMFKEDWIQFESKEPEQGDYYVSVDLAGYAEEGKSKRKQKRLDNTAISVVKVNQDGWWVKQIIYGRWDLKETAQKIFDAVKYHQPLCVGIEQGALRNAVISPLKDLMRRNNTYFRIEELRHGNKNKIDRIVWALQGRFENGVIKLCPGDWTDTFLDELFQFPDPLTHDDMPDSLSYIDQMAQVSYWDQYELDEHEYTDAQVGY